MSARAALTVVDVLEEAGLVAALKIPSPRNLDGFLRIILLDGANEVQRGVTVSRVIEVEAWHPRPGAAIDLAEQSREILFGAVGTHGIRAAWTENHVAELPTGEENWERYRYTIGLSFREPKERIDQR